jgi:hypothetical protein
MEVWMIRKLSGLALIALLAACSDSTSPKDFNPATTQQKADAVLAAFDGNPVLRSLAVLGPAIQLSAAQPALAAAPFDPTASPTTLRARVRALEDQPSFGVAGTQALFPADLLGKTFVYDTTTARYAVDDARTGGPADGVRLILYAVDPVLNQVLRPLQEIGYFDLRDVSTPSEDAVRLVAVVNNVTYLDYTASATRTTNSTAIGAVGYLSNGTDQVDFDLTYTLTHTLTTTSVQINYQLSSGSNSVGLVGTVDANDSIQATLTIKGGSDTVVVEVAWGPSTIDGQITYNGTQAVVIGGSPDNPTFTRPDGTPLTQDEIASLDAIGNIFEVLFDAFDNLLGPAVVVFALG